jgi:hypothetical protein
MKILFLTSAHNSLSQRLLVELTARGHDIHVCVAATGDAMDRCGIRRDARFDYCADVKNRDSGGGLVALCLPYRTPRY